MSKAELVREYFELQEQAKAIEERRSELSDKLKEMGTFSTREFNVVVEIRNRTALKGLEIVAKAVGREVLEENDLITTSQFKTVRVIKKGA